jgi:hypothetical protein
VNYWLAERVGRRIQAGDNRTFKDAQEVFQRLRNARNNALFFSFTFLSHAETRFIRGLRRFTLGNLFCSPLPPGDGTQNAYLRNSCRILPTLILRPRRGEGTAEANHLARLARILILRKHLFLICSKAVRPIVPPPSSVRRRQAPARQEGWRGTPSAYPCRGGPNDS